MEDRKILEKLKSRHRQLYSDRQLWVTGWMNLRDYVAPDYGQCLSGAAVTTERKDGRKNRSKIVNEEASLCADTLAAGLMGGVTNQTQPWFKMQPEDPDLLQFQPVKVWLDAVEDAMRGVFSSSNLYQSLRQVYYELGVFGIGAQFEKRDDHDIIRFRPFTIGEYWVALDENLRVCAFYNESYWTAQQCVNEFGEERVTATTRENYRRGNLDADVLVMQAVERTDWLGMDKKTFPFEYCSCFFEKEADDKVLRCEGYDTFPVQVARWEIVGNKTYGIGPGKKLLPSIKALQKLQQKIFKKADYEVDPAIIAPSALKSTGVDLSPGSTNFSDDPQLGNIRPVYQPLPMNPVVLEEKRDLIAQIRRGFYTDLFQMLLQGQGPQMTAEEVNRRWAEKVMLLSPVLQNLHNELLSPLIARTYRIMRSAGALPPPPREIHGQNFSIKYQSILSQAAEAFGASTIQQFISFTGNVAAASPSALDNINLDNVIRRYHQAVGAPADLLNDKRDVDKVRAMRQQKQQQQELLAQTAAAVQGAKTLSETDTGGNNALTNLLGGIQGVVPVAR